VYRNVVRQINEVIHTNKKHPFLTVEKGFLPVGQINLGMHVVEADGQVGVISGWKVVSGIKVMYNLEVAQDHTFVVGVGQWVVHNCGGDNFVKDVDGKLRGVSDPNNAVPGEPNLYTGHQTDPASNWKLKPGPPKVAYPNSEDFFDFLRQNGKSTAGWRYVMREYDTPLGPGKDHFWWDGGAEFFHHD
jgi:hypothetical protein